MVRVQLTGEKETLLITLYGRAVDARSRRPILGDEMAAHAVEQIDYDFSRTKVTPGVAASVAVRAKHFDRWTAEFLAAHERAHQRVTVLHLAAGLDTRAWRVAPGPGVSWYDVDYPEVIELRRTLYPTHPAGADYRMIGSSVTAPGWLDEIPVDQPTLVVAEGLSMYLQPDDGRELLRRLTEHVAHGAIAFDAFNWLSIRLQRFNPAGRGPGATMYWAIDDPHELERANPRLHLVDALPALYAPGSEELPFGIRAAAALFRPLPALRDLALYLRYAF